MNLQEATKKFEEIYQSGTRGEEIYRWFSEEMPLNLAFLQMLIHHQGFNLVYVFLPDLEVNCSYNDTTHQFNYPLINSLPQKLQEKIAETKNPIIIADNLRGMTKESQHSMIKILTEINNQCPVILNENYFMLKWEDRTSAFGVYVEEIALCNSRVIENFIQMKKEFRKKIDSDQDMNAFQSMAYTIYLEQKEHEKALKDNLEKPLIENKIKPW